MVREVPRPTNITVEESHFQRVSEYTVTDPAPFCYRFCLSGKNKNSVLGIADIHAGDFLGRLWTLFGEPDACRTGFGYPLLYTPANLPFTAYHDAMAAYGSPEQDPQKLVPVLYYFEELLKRTTPTECSYVFDSGYGRYMLGVENGQPYYEKVTRLDKQAFIAQPVTLTAPVTLRLEELDTLLQVYTSFYTLEHGQWLFKDPTMTKTKIQLSGLPVDLQEEEFIKFES